MDEPVPETIPDIEADDEVIAELRDIRAWRAEQRAKYGMDWEDNDPPGCSDYERSRGLVPTDPPA